MVKLKSGPRATMGSASRDRVSCNLKGRGPGKLMTLRSTLSITKCEQNPGPAAYNFTPTIGSAPTYANIGLKRTYTHNFVNIGRPNQSLKQSRNLKVKENTKESQKRINSIMLSSFKKPLTLGSPETWTYQYNQCPFPALPSKKWDYISLL